MSVLNSDAALPRVDESQFEALYKAQSDFLFSVAVHKFRVPESEADTLVHEVFLSYLKRADEIRNVNGWLLGAICHASRYYWRSNGRMVVVEEQFDRIDPKSLNILDSLPNQLAAREVLACLPARCQSVLRLRYFDGCSIAEIATQLDLTAKYTQKLVMKCLHRAERMYTAKERKKGKGKA
jgi:RNA polymerase sigma factor (sigma-70 family)